MEEERVAIEKDLKFNLLGITLDNLNNVAEKVLEFASTNADNCKKVVDIMFEDIVDEEKYADYAKLCNMLRKSDKLSFNQPKGPTKEKENDFWTQLKTHIETTLQGLAQSHKELKTNKETKPVHDSLYSKQKERLRGNIIFIGYLYTEKLIENDTVRIITNRLLEKYLEEYNIYQKVIEKPSHKAYEDTMESLVGFYSIVGQVLEEDKTRKIDQAKSNAMVESFQSILELAKIITYSHDPLPKLNDYEISVNDFFKILNIILHESSLSNECIKLLKGLVSKRENRWQSPKTTNQNAMIMEENYEEFEREQEGMEEDQSGNQITSGA